MSVIPQIGPVYFRCEALRKMRERLTFLETCFRQDLDRLLASGAITGRDFANRTGLSPSFVADLRAGKRAPSQRVIDAVLAADWSDQ